MRKPMQEWAREIYQTAKAHGWHDGGERSISAYASLIHSELSEALEEARSGRPMVYGEDFEEGKRIEDLDAIRALGCKPEGIAVEMLDCVIRILDYAMATWGEPGPHNAPDEWDDFAQPIREYHGTKLAEMPLEETIALGHWYISHAWEQATRAGQLREYDLEDLSSLLIAWVQAHGVDAEAVMELKHQYNKTRSYRHGGKLL